MSEQVVPRPRQVTLGGWLITLGSVVMLGLTFQRISTLGSIGFQETTSKTLSDPPLDGLSITVDDVQSIVRILCLVTGACAAAAVVLGLYVLRRSRGSRLALSILAPVLFLAGFVVASLAAAFVTVGIVLLWLQPARAWFEPASAGPVQAPRPAAVETPPRPPPTGQSWSGPWAAPAVHPAYPVAGRAPRPGRLVAACVITWVGSGLAAGAALLTLLVVLVNPDSVTTPLHQDLADAGVTDHQFLVGVYVFVGILVPWCLVGSVFAIGAFRGTSWGWTGLLVCASVAALVSVLAVIGNVVAVLPMAACLTTVTLLLRPEVRSWFARPPG